MTSLRALTKDLTPPALLRLGGRLAGRSSDYRIAPTSWDEAVHASSGYADTAILERVVRATRDVVAGRAAAERDSVLFDHLALPYQLLAPLLRSAMRQGGGLEVIDFGGSLGSSYRHCRAFLSPVQPLTWHVIEQPAFVAAGRAEFETDELRFHDSLDELPPPAAARVIVTSSVIQYLPNPAAFIDRFARIGASAWLVDRTPFSDEPHDRLCIQSVPRHIYAASYPFWVLSRPRFDAQVANHWRTLDTFECPEGSQVARGAGRFRFQGIVLERFE